MWTSKGIVATFVICMAVFNLAYMAPAYFNATHWLGNEEHRLPNIREIREECRAPFIRKFIGMQDWSKPTLAVFGDSQPFNRNFPAVKSWPNILAQKAGWEDQIINLAVIDGRPGDTAYVAEQVLTAGVRVQRSFANINQSHYAAAPNYRYVPAVEAEPFEFLRCTLSLRRQFVTEAMPLPWDGNAREDFTKIPLSPDRYKIDFSPVYATALQNMVASVAQVSANSVFYITSNNLGVFSLYGFDRDAFLQDSETLRESCNTVPEATCLNLANSLSQDSFYDIVHLNSAGNAALAGVFKTALP